jgi:predicted ATPase/DNA-binding CsgD family transcriptional regulator
MSVGQATQQQRQPPAQRAKPPGPQAELAMPQAQVLRHRPQLPVETTGLVGREAELAHLGALLEQARLVTVTGPGGVGKTRLALRAAATAAGDFADGACLVELAAVHDPALLPYAVARALGLAEPGPVAQPGHSPQLQPSAQLEHSPQLQPGAQLERSAVPDEVLGYLADRQLLLILDSCEHLVDACAMLAEAIIARAPQVTLLATSREPLDVSGENACPVPPLPVPDADGLPGGPPVRFADGGYGAGRPAGEPPGGLAAATRAAESAEAAEAVRPVDYRGTAVELFIQRAAAAVPGFSLAPGDLSQVIRLCQRLDGMPLAIELAAVRLRALPLAELANRLDQSLALLTSGRRGGHHRTLRDAISWSHELCSPAEQAMWARLSVFAGPFTMSGAEEVCAGDLDPGLVMPTLIRLVDKSLLIRIDAADGAGRPTRYLMLGTFREFGAGQLAGTDAEAPARRRLVGRYLGMARHFADRFAGDEQLPRLEELRREYANVRAALEYALDDQALDDQAGLDGVELATALCAYWRARSLLSEGCYWLGRAVARAPAGSSARARALLARGQLLTVQGRATGALADVAEALDLAAELADATLIARGQLVRTGALVAAGRLREAAEAGEEAWRLLSGLDDRLGLVSLDLQLAYLALLTEDTGAALGYVDRGLRQLDGSRERWLHASLYLLAALTLYQADRDIESTWTATKALQVKQETGDRLGTAFALEVLAWLAARSGSYQRAAWLLGGADPLWEGAGGRAAATTAFWRRHDEVMAACEAALGGKRLGELFTKGAVHPLDTVVSFALSDGGDPAAEAATRIRLPGQLTAREREIASLVAAGLSNRQIAERLFISRRTVDAHLEHIFGKLGITSRVMLTIQLREYAAEPGSDANA